MPLVPGSRWYHRPQAPPARPPCAPPCSCSFAGSSPPSAAGHPSSSKYSSCAISSRSTRGLPAPPHRSGGRGPLVLLGQSLGRLARAPAVRQAADRPGLATHPLPRPLASLESGRPTRGRPPIAKELRELIRRLSRANPTWGSPRIVGELAKLGIHVAKSTVARYRVRPDAPPSPTWRVFLDGLRRHLGLLGGVEAVAVGGAHTYPVRGAVAGSGMAIELYEGLEQ
jgi:hypothetical protein